MVCFICQKSFQKLGFSTDEEVEVLVLKLEPDDILALMDNKKFFKAYHMNKKHWISIILDDEALSFTELCALLDESYKLSK